MEKSISILEERATETAKKLCEGLSKQELKQRRYELKNKVKDVSLDYRDLIKIYAEIEVIDSLNKRKNPAILFFTSALVASCSFIVWLTFKI